MEKKLATLENLVMTLSSLRSLKVLVTGHTGFKGSWLSLMLSKLDVELHGIALEAQAESMFNICRISELYKTSSILDIRSEISLSEKINSINPDFIFHLAAQPIVSLGYKNSLETFSTNVMGTVNLLEAVRTNPKEIKGIVIVTSDKCYENNEENVKFVEGNPLGGDDPYSASKACAELVSASYYKSFFSNIGIGLATARAGNVIGGGDFSTDRLVPDIYYAYKKGVTLNVRNSKSIRPWQHVIDPVYGYLLLADNLIKNTRFYSGSWNFSPNINEIFSVKDIIDKFAKLIPIRINEVPLQFNESNHLALDSTKSKNNLNWHSILDIDSTVNYTIDWYLNYLQNKVDMREFSLSQLTELKF
jgi:CDP-glucose 4,6-dehydratase